MGTAFKRTGEKRWSIAWLDETGRRRSKRSSKDRRVAQEELRQLEDRAERLRLGMPVEGQLERKLMADALTAYREELTALGRSPVYVSGLFRRLDPLIRATGWRHVDAITGPGLAEYLAKIAARGAAPMSRNQYRADVRAFCEFAISREWLAENPIVRVPRANVGQPGDPTHRPGSRRAFTMDEFERLTSCRRIPAWRRSLYRIACLSGLRAAELHALERQDFSLGHQPRWHLRAAITKSRRRDEVPMLPECAESLAGVCLDAGPRTRLFPKRPRPETVKIDMKRAGIVPIDHTGRKLSMHSCRFFFCWLVGRSLPLQTVRVLMRHSSITTTVSIYLSLGLADVTEQIRMLPPLLTTISEAG